MTRPTARAAPALTDPALTDPALTDLALTDLGGHLLRRAQQVHHDLWAGEVPELTSPQYAVLEAVGARPGADQRHVSRVASLDRSSTVEVVGRLERRGLLVRARDRADSRRDALLLADGAAAVLAGVRPGVATVQRRLVEPLAAGEHDFLAGALRTVAALGTVGGAGGVPSLLALPGHLVRRAQQRHTVLFAEEFGRDLTGPQYAALHVVRHHPGVHQRGLGEAAALDRSTTADLVRRLAARGLLAKERDPADARRWCVRLTEAGAGTAAAYAVRVDRVQDRLLGGLGEADRTRLIAALGRLARLEG